jgi:gliding motility-associated-like protein
MLLSTFLARATHVVGGGITYTHLGGAEYLLTIKLYRDCSPGTYDLPPSVDLEVRHANGTEPPTSSYNLPLVNNEVIIPDVPACVFDPGICVEEAIYESTVTMSEGTGGFHLYFTICCRNATIINILDPLTARETFYAYLPDVADYPSNSSPVFNNMPPVYVCAGEELNLDFSASDPDGDSLVYNFYTPFDGFNGTGITYGPGAAPDNIDISPITWQPGFGATDPLDVTPGLLPGLTISDAGLIEGVPFGPGQFVVGVMVDEYRDGELMGRITRDFQFNVLNCPPPIEAGANVPDICDGLTVAFENTSSVTATDFWWDFGTGNPADSSIAFEPTFTYPAPGTYTATLIVQKGTDCADTTTVEFTIDEPIDFTVTTTAVNCAAGSDGAAAALPDDGTYSYEWSTMSTDDAISGLTAGTYWVEATNALGCVDTQLFDIVEPDPLAVDFTTILPNCYEGEDGSIIAEASGGTAPYTYEWEDPLSTDATLTDIGAGVYDLTVTDANGCVFTASSNLTQPPELLVNINTITNATCNGYEDGAVSISFSGGVGGYVVDWLGLEDDAPNMTDLGAGTYIADVTDANGCQAIVIAVIEEPDPFTADLVVIQEESCSDANGMVYANTTGGIGDLTYVWEPVSGDTDVVSGLSSGTISVTVSDENGCLADASVFLPDNETGTASVGDASPVSCAGESDGSVSVEMTGGTPPFSYSWSCACPDSSVLYDVPVGNYTVIIVDANGCVEEMDVTVDALPPLIVGLVETTEPLCFGDENGSAEVTAWGGTPPYSYSWNTEPVQYTPAAINIGAGNYIATVTDANGCDNALYVPLEQPDQLLVSTEVLSNILCFGDSAGVVTAAAIGGTSPYNFYWPDVDETTDTIGGLVSGFYDVTVTDLNGCEVNGNAEIIEYDKVIAEIEYDSIVCPGETIDFVVLTNDINNLYDYNWYVNDVFAFEGNAFSSTITEETVISIDLISDYGCPPIYDTIVVQPIVIDPENLSVIGTPDTICQGGDALIEAIVEDMTYITDLWWTDASLIGPGPHNVFPEGPSEYTVSIRNICGEELSADLFIPVFVPPVVNITADGTSGCDLIQTQFQFEVGEYDYGLDNFNWTLQTENYSNINPLVVEFGGSGNIHTNLTMEFDNGCTFEFSKVVGVEVLESPDADFYYNPDPARQAELTELIDISKGNPEFWEWYVEGEYISSEERPMHLFEEARMYEVKQVVIDYNGCSDTAIHWVEVIGDFTVYVPNAFTPDGNGRNNYFKPVLSNILEDGYEFLVFNRWGEVVFQTNDLNTPWDGTYAGNPVKEDIYVWKILVRDNRSERHEFNGHVTLLR